MASGLYSASRSGSDAALFIPAILSGGFACIIVDPAVLVSFSAWRSKITVVVCAETLDAAMQINSAKSETSFFIHPEFE